MKVNQKDTELLLNTIVDAISDIKGENVVALDLRDLPDAVTQFFVVCHGNSTTQVHAIGQNIIDKTKEKIGERPWHKEGFRNSEWICVDYSNIVVHVFHKDTRDFYRLEDLWNDAKRIEFSEKFQKVKLT